MDETKPKRSRSDTVIVVGVILLAVFVLGIRHHMTSESAKETALISELRSLRMAVQLYMLENKAPPSDLKILAAQKYNIAGRQESYIKGVSLDNDGYPVDSFGKRFNYDRNIGWIYSSSTKYTKW